MGFNSGFKGLNKRVDRFLHFGPYRGASSAGAIHTKTITTEHLRVGGALVNMKNII